MYLKLLEFNKIFILRAGVEVKPLMIQIVCDSLKSYVLKSVQYFGMNINYFSTFKKRLQI